MYDCVDWYAWFNRMPGTSEPNVLHVTGTCTMPDGRTRVWLEPANEGVVDDPTVYVLELKVELPTGAADVTIPCPVRWDGEVDPAVERVVIRGEADATIHVEIAT
jgi:hypothetical protein